MSHARSASNRPPKKGGTLPLADPSKDVDPPSSLPVSLPEPTSQSDLIAASDLPADAPEWMRQGRIMAATIDAAMTRGAVSEHVRAAIHRGWVAWSLGGVRPRQIASVARLVDRAHRTLRDSTRADRTSVEQDCATVLYNGLPSARRKQMHRDDVLDVVRDLRTWLDPDDARVRATARLLGWTDACGDWMAEAVASALREE